MLGLLDVRVPFSTAQWIKKPLGLEGEMWLSKMKAACREV